MRFEDCHFYHTVELPGVGLVRGAWDLRGREAQYTGGIQFRGKRVLEIGPASGGLTAWMEGQGAAVTAFESEEGGIDILPSAKEDLVAHKDGSNLVLRQVKNAWLFARAALRLQAEIEYGNVNTIPGKLGPFEIVTLGAILVHCQSPPAVVHQACLAATEAVVVTDLVTPGLETETDSLVRFNPSQGASLIYWWGLSPGAIVNMLTLNGFGDCRVTYHEQMHHPVGDFSLPLTPAKMFTVVGWKVNRMR